MSLLSPLRLSLSLSRSFSLIKLTSNRFNNLTACSYYCNSYCKVLNSSPSSSIYPYIQSKRSYCLPKKKPEIVIENRVSYTTLNAINKNIDTIKIIPTIIIDVKDTQISKKDDKVEITAAETSNGIFKRFKKMYKEYWYVLLPVHLVTSACWLGGFYYVSQSGVDIPSFMESIGFSETYIKPLRDSKLGHIAVAYLLYKVVTPLRYTVTLGGTTVSIKYLVARGYIKPVPTKEELMKKYKDRVESSKKAQ